MKTKFNSLICTACHSFSGAVFAGAVMLSAFSVQAQNLFVSDYSSHVYEFTPGGVQSTFATGMNYPTGIAFNSAGDLFVGNSDNNNGEQGNITEITPSGVQSVFASGVDPIGLAFNNAGNLFETDYRSGNIYEFTPSGVQSTFATLPESGINGLAFNNPGDLLVATGQTGSIIEITPSGVQSTFASGLGASMGLAFQNETLPVPEPSTLGLLAVGLFGITLWRRHQG